MDMQECENRYIWLHVTARYTLDPCTRDPTGMDWQMVG